jgi:hypothetical protein
VIALEASPPLEVEAGALHVIVVERPLEVGLRDRDLN